MNADLLLQHFDRISEAPDAIPRLRQFILDLAVRGKLVEQDPNDEPAAELLKRIEKEKARLVKEGKIRRQNPLPPVDQHSVPFQVPGHWAWLQLNGLGLLSGGMTPSKNRPEFWDGDINWFSPKDIKSDELIESELKITSAGVAETGLQLYRPGCLFIVARSGILKRTFPVAINRVEATANQDLKVLTPFIEGLERYLQIMFRGITEYILSALVKTGTTVQSLKYEEFELQPLPLPPLAEQYRIVAKVDELMTLCDQLEAAKIKREQSRDRLVTASLHRLNQPADTAEGDALDALSDHARFIFNHLSRLTTHPAHIKQLRQTILNLAVRGKLVPQDPNDEPAAELLKRMLQSKQQHGTQSRKSAKLQQLNDENGELPFQIPSNWLWLRIDALFEVAGGIQKTPSRAPRSNVFPYLGVGNVYRGRIDLTTVKKFELQDGELERWQLEVGDLLIIEGNGSLSEIGRCAVWNGEIESCVHQNHVIRCRPLDLQISPFVLQFLNSPAGTAIMQRLAITSSGLYSLSVGKIRQIEVPLPPLAEQHRIVAKVDELMALCDQLEAQLTTTEADSRRLLEAVLHEALNPPLEATEQ